MGGIRLFSGNRLEILAQRLAEELSVPLPDPFEKEIIVVQSRGMEHWLSMQLARHQGVCANIDFPFPASMVDRLFRLVPGNAPDKGIMSEQAMVWEIMETLPKLVAEPSFEPVRAYIEDDPAGVRLYQLSMRLAELFDNYIIFRPAMIAAWDRGRQFMPGEHAAIEAWQSRLWRETARGREHAASMRERFLKSLDQVPAERLPRRISLFGISYLPPFYLEIFHGLSTLMTVNFFLLNPCRQYWGDIRSENEIARMTTASGNEDARELFLEEGNSLLAAMGASVRDLFDMLQDLDPEDHDESRDIPGKSLLERVQADILDLRHPQEDDPLVSDRDNSIQVHSCHSPMREVEVLKDNLLALFDGHPGLMPEQVLVMAPSIEKYIPFIRAVFDTEAGDRTRIPYRIVDRSLKSSSSLADTLVAVFDLSLSRFEASRVTA
ncbi:exonuclease V subunit gamma, partial [bacterium]|nr:exonuclease V subunit gamma [bacterium]